MATVKTCDKCGAAGAQTAEASVIVRDSAAEGQTTATTFGADLCPACFDAGMLELFGQSLARHHVALPIIKRINELTMQGIELAAAKDAAVIARDENADPARADALVQAAQIAVDAWQANIEEIKRLQAL